MKQRTQLLCAYTGYVFMALFFVAFMLADFIPPPDPSLGPKEIQDHFQENADGIRAGMFIACGAAALLLFWNGALTAQLKRIEGRNSALVYANVAAGGCLVMEFLFPQMWWVTAAFRPDGDPEIIQRLHDLAWLPFLGLVSTAVAQCVIIAILTLQDKSPNPVFPRWFAYFNIWCGTLFWPGPMIMFFKDGPFSWNGAISWWMVLTVFTIWLVVVTYMVARAIKADTGDLADDPGGGGNELAHLRAEVAGLRAEVDSMKEGVPA